jgi:hypothetical protein
VGDDFHLIRGGPERDVRDAIADFRALPERERRRVRALMGHVPYGAHEWLPQPSVYATMLRDPVDRLVSMFYFIRSGAKDNSTETVSQMSLVEFAESPPVANAADAHVRFLAGRQDWGQLTEFDPVTADDVELAKRRLDEFAVVGLTERFDESAGLIGEVMGWPITIPRRRRVTPDRPSLDELPARVLVRLRAACEPDDEVYAHARTLFERRRARSGG